MPRGVATRALRFWPGSRAEKAVLVLRALQCAWCRRLLLQRLAARSGHRGLTRGRRCWSNCLPREHQVIQHKDAREKLVSQDQQRLEHAEQQRQAVVPQELGLPHPGAKRQNVEPEDDLDHRALDVLDTMDPLGNFGIVAFRGGDGVQVKRGVQAEQHADRAKGERHARTRVVHHGPTQVEGRDQQDESHHDRHGDHVAIEPTDGPSRLLKSQRLPHQARQPLDAVELQGQQHQCDGSADEEVEPDVLEHGLREREEPQVVEGRVQLPKPDVVPQAGGLPLGHGPEGAEAVPLDARQVREVDVDDHGAVPDGGRQARSRARPAAEHPEALAANAICGTCRG
mmetsp:Transcript_20453/g.57891  ORF Transcript_20453/g.57891 Transcript_20453/m.57891 type:complete len:341 (-) Transcript_20453:121-1143(-)